MVSVLVTILLILASVGTGGYLILRELLENVFGMPFLAGVLIGCILCLGLLSGHRKYAIGSSAFLAVVLAAGIFFWKGSSMAVFPAGMNWQTHWEAGQGFT